jgi:hypothetical protein
MKTFYNFDDAFNWIKTVNKETIDKVIPLIAEEVYKDSKEYTYIDTEEMYDSGSSSDFNKGYVVIRAPQVRWLYYTTGINAGKGNPNAIPQWFERTKIENISKYKQIYANQFRQGVIK